MNPFNKLPTQVLRAAVCLGLLGLFATLTGPLITAAHESRTVVDGYEFEVGFVNEPAIADEINGVLLEITREGQPVEGVGEALQVQILFGDQTKDVVLTPSIDAPGTYTAIFIPTVEGEYTFRFFGQLEGTAVDEYFTSSPEGFESVAPRSDYAFPLEEDSAARRLNLPVLTGGMVVALGALGMVTRRPTHRAL
jgi:hypothetical protein